MCIAVVSYLSPSFTMHSLFVIGCQHCLYLRFYIISDFHYNPYAPSCNLGCFINCTMHLLISFLLSASFISTEPFANISELLHSNYPQGQTHNCAQRQKTIFALPHFCTLCISAICTSVSLQDLLTHLLCTLTKFPICTSAFLQILTLAKCRFLTFSFFASGQAPLFLSNFFSTFWLLSAE